MIDGSPVADPSGAKGQCCHIEVPRRKSVDVPQRLCNAARPPGGPAGASCRAGAELAIS